MYQHIRNIHYNFINFSNQITLECEMCKNEITRSNYIIHMASECEIRCMNLKCKYCEITYENPGNFSQHVKTCKIYSKFIENVENGFRCRICGKKVASKRIELNGHIRNCKGQNYNLFQNDLKLIIEERKNKPGKSQSYERKQLTEIFEANTSYLNISNWCW